jgi:GT2 family glycosyltransferase
MKKSKPKVFAGSKPSDFYNADYYLNGVNGNYGRRDESGKQVFAPYDEANYLPRNRQLAQFIASTYKPKTALVLGCARAYLVQALRELGVDAKGIDISQWAIDNAPQKIKEHLYIGDICDLSRFKTAQFDVVTAFDVFEHITVPDLYTAIGEASRVCKDTMIIDVPLNPDDLHPDQSSGTDKSHVSVYSEKFWIEQFACTTPIQHSSWGKLEGKEVYTYPSGDGGGTFIFRKTEPLPTSTPNKAPVSILMLNWNGLKFSPKSIDTLYRNTDYPFRLTVVDNQSTDGSQDWLNFASQSYPNMEVVYSKTLNTGYADGCNIGLRHIKESEKYKESIAPYILLLNNDTLFTQKSWLSEMVKVLESNPDIGIVTPKLLYPDGRIQYGGASFTQDMQPYHIGRFKNKDSFNSEREIPWGTFACALIRREILFTYDFSDINFAKTQPQVTGLDDAYKLGTFEDVDLCCKARLAGYKIMYAPQARVYHYEGATVFTVNKSHYQQQQQANAALFYSRWREWLRFNRNAHPEVYS